MKNKVVIGSSSQISQFLPDSDFLKIDSRNIDYTKLSKNWELVILAFGENRKNIDNQNLYHDINVTLTQEVLDFFVPRSEKIIVFSTCELWSKCSGPVDLNTKFEHFDTPYILSKKKITEIILENPKKYPNTHVMFPFNFNSVYRNQNFLFGKIFKSITEKTEIEIGDSYFYRDIIHPNFVVEKIVNSAGHEVIGSGRLTFVNDFIRDLYKEFNLEYESLVKEDMSSFREFDKKYEYYLKSKDCVYTYKNLLLDTVNEISNLGYKQN
jgi:nucleoside-diphosphate-sugar epimerase